MKVKKIFLSQKGFTLVEFLVSLIVIAIFASFYAVNLSSQEQTAKQEAEKIAAYLTDLTRKADRRHISFRIVKNSSGIIGYWDGTKSSFDIYSTSDGHLLNKDFTMTASQNEFNYNAEENKFTQRGHFTITRPLDGSSYYIIISNGRIRTSDNDADDVD